MKLSKEEIENCRKRCRAFGNYMEEDKWLCGKCETELKEKCKKYMEERK